MEVLLTTLGVAISAVGLSLKTGIVITVGSTLTCTIWRYTKSKAFRKGMVDCLVRQSASASTGTAGMVSLRIIACTQEQYEAYYLKDILTVIEDLAPLWRKQEYKKLVSRVGFFTTAIRKYASKGLTKGNVQKSAEEAVKESFPFHIIWG